MKLIIDSHIFIWWTLTPEKLSKTAIDLLHDDENTLLLSIASIWEMQIKISLKKLHFDLPLSEIVENQKTINDVQILPIELYHIWGLENLPYYHRDPFDRILVTQAITEDLPIMSIDSVFDNYSVQILW